MKKFILIVLAVMIIAAVGVVIVAQSGGDITKDSIGSWFTKDGYKSQDIMLEQVIEVNSNKSISISDVSENINVYITDDKEVKAILHGSYSSNKQESPKLVISEKNDKVLINIEYDNRFALFNYVRNSLMLDIYLPSEYVGNLTLKSVSGDIKMEETSLKELVATTVSGDIAIEDVLAETIELNTVSGNINSTGSSNEICASTVSGDMKIHSVLTGYFDSVSGDIKIYLTDEQNFDLKYSTISGDYVINTPITLTKTSGNNIEAIAGNGIECIEVNTVSGDFTLN